MATRKKNSKKPRFPLVKQYLAPGGIGAIVGALATLATTVPQLLDKTEELAAQREELRQLETKMGLVEADLSAYSKVLQQRFPALLDDEVYYALFPTEARTLVAYEEGEGTDAWFAAELKKSEEGAFFVWCTGGYDSRTHAAFYGSWLTRPEAIKWASQYVSAQDFQRIFTLKELERAENVEEVDICGWSSELDE